MKVVMKTATGSTQNTRLRAFGRRITKVLTRKKINAEVEPVRMGLKNQERMMGTMPCSNNQQRQHPATINSSPQQQCKGCGGFNQWSCTDAGWHMLYLYTWGCVDAS